MPRHGLEKLELNPSFEVLVNNKTYVVPKMAEGQSVDLDTSVSIRLTGSTYKILYNSVVSVPVTELKFRTETERG
jgi:hypothetical protein